MESKLFSSHHLDAGLPPILDMNSTTVDFFAAFMDRPSCMFSTSPRQVSPDIKGLNLGLAMNTKENVREISHCKRKLDFADNYLGLERPQTVSVARRNERERNRVKLINMTFAKLREHIPQLSKGGKTRKLSKVETLRAAIDYIRYLQGMMETGEGDSSSHTSRESCMSPTLSSSPPTSVTSPSLSTTSSPASSSFGNLSAEDDDLLDFANWF